MKHLLLILLVLPFLSCSSLTENQVSQAAMTVSMTVPSAVRLAVAKEPRAARPLLALAVSLEGFTTGFDPVDVDAVVNSSGIKEIRSDEAKAVIQGALDVYQVQYLEAVTKNESVAKLVPILNAISTSIRIGLQTANQ